MRSALFVPGTRPDRFGKAAQSGADVVILDLEDAVAPKFKSQARDALNVYAKQQPEQPLWVRINAADTPWFDDDLAVCSGLDHIAGIILPKAQPGSARHVASIGKPVIPIIETARGLQLLAETARVAGVERLTFGILDLAAELGVRKETPAEQFVLDHTRFQVLVASHANELAQPLDTVYANFSDTDGLQRRATAARDLGYAGMLCIHPRQVPIANQTYTVSADEIAWAKRVLQQFEAAGEQAFRLDGRMVDLPVIKRAQSIIDAAALQN